jgi:tRNA nucleotidyltransferase (CCA-adding enzyme)
MWYDASMTYLDRTDDFIASLGVEAYRVGGSVRDELIGRRVKDADYMVRGQSLFALGSALGAVADGAAVTPLKLRDGRQVGYCVHKRGLGLIEIALPRTEVSTGPGHRDFEIVVEPSLSLEDDAKRRDFTFNALYRRIASDGVQDILDPTGQGIYDLGHRFIRTTHSDSFRDDPLRTLRALRFISTLGYELAPTTAIEMRAWAECVDGLTKSGNTSGTVLDELSKLLMGQQPDVALRLARDTGVLAALLPELAPMLGFEQESKYHDLTTDEHTFKALQTASHVDAPLRVRMALLFHDSGKPDVAWRGKDGRKHFYANPDDPLSEDHELASARRWRDASARMNVPNGLRNDVTTLILNHMVNVVGNVKPSKVRRARVRFGDEMLRDLYLHRMCDLSGKDKASSDYLKKIGVLEQVRQAAESDKVPASPRDLAIDGRDLISLGATGREIGDVMRRVLDEVVCNPKEQMLTRAWQLERANSLLKEAL